ncbi:protein of unknown function (plasmid) [Cardinium endosymbiont cEper1 of Encarsia pergandiella]|nr:protein of unknown function [Cardinium endosymbiont cEper1 of Encarsia pergandiella]
MCHKAIFIKNRKMTLHEKNILLIMNTFILLYVSKLSVP